MSILADVVVEAENQFYGKLIVSNIRYEGGSAVSIKGFLGVVFLSPAPVATTDVNPTTNPWVEITAQTTNVEIGPSVFEVTAQLNFASAYTINSSTILTFGINGDLTKNPELYRTSFLFAADQFPDITGTVNIECAAAPDPELAPYLQTLTFTQGGVATPISVPLGTTTQSKLGRGTYTITAAELTTPAQTVVAQAQVSPATVTVVTGQSVTVSVTYSGTPTKYSAIDVVMEKITPLEKEKLYVSVVVAGVPVADFSTPNPHTTQLRRLPPSGIADVNVEPLTLNNFRYSFQTKSKELSPSLFTVVFSQTDLITEAVPTTGFVTLAVTVETAHGLDTTIPVRLTSDRYIYTQAVEAQPGTTTFAALVAPGIIYTVQAPSFIHDGSVYFVQAPTTLAVEEDGSTELILKVQPGPSLHVRGFPSFLSFGGCTDLTDGNQADFVAARASSIFKYAGVSGDGDPTLFLTDDPATSRTISLARAVEQQLDDGNPVLPVMISYTCNLSGGDPETRLQNEEGLKHSFGNFILSLKLAKKTIDADHPVPAGYIVNADFLGACQQHGLTPGYEMPVRAPLQDGLDHWEVKAEIPSTITDTLRGYVQAVNWLVRTFAPEVTFGWQVNLWGVGTSAWVYEDTDPASIAEKTATYARSLAAYGDDNGPDFLAVDRYERDDFDPAAYNNGYCYGPREWGRYFDFCRALSLDLQVPVMPWQISAARTPLVHDTVYDDFSSQHWGTGGSYIMGDPGINSDYHNVNPKILALKFMPEFPHMGKTAEEMFQRSEPFDLTEPAYLDFPLRGIFSVLLGGGSTTGIVSSIGNPEPWVRRKLATYMANPIPFGGANADDSY